MEQNTHVIIVLLIIMMLGMYFLYQSIYEINFNVEQPFLHIKDENGNNTEFMLYHAWLFSKEKERQYKILNKKYILIGATSYQAFPKVTNPESSWWEHTHDYESMCKIWLHCFRNPDEFFKRKPPLALISHSDFADYKYITPKNLPIKYDFVYSVQKDGDNCEIGWHGTARNWTLALKCLPLMCKKYKLRGIIIGRKGCNVDVSCNGLMEYPDFMPQEKLFEYIDSCKFVFVPNVLDASPRLSAQTLCKNKPLLMNYNILGGWKYIKSGVSGEFFTSEKDIGPAIDKILTNYNSYTPRSHFIENFGKHAPIKLRNFVAKHYPQAEKYKELRL